MTNAMYISGCHGVSPLRHRYGCHGVIPHIYVIGIYRICIYCRPDIATWRLRDHDSFLFIVRVLLSQTIDDSSYVYKWLPWSNLFLRHRYGCHGVTPYVIAIYSKVFPYTTHALLTHPYLR